MLIVIIIVIKMKLSDVIGKDKNMRKLFGQRELHIIEKQLKGVKLSASEKTRLSRDIRKKFMAINELVPFVSEFNLKYGKEVKDIIEETVDVIITSAYRPKIKRIILFGSVVDNSMTLRSDIDIAVEFSKKVNVSRFRLDILKKVDDRVDIQVYNSLPKKIKKEIDGRRKVLWKKG
jgi:predicted nucleotidyltransferase